MTTVKTEVCYCGMAAYRPPEYAVEYIAMAQTTIIVLLAIVVVQLGLRHYDTWKTRQLFKNGWADTFLASLEKKDDSGTRVD